MSKIVPFFAADQPIVDQLCTIIDALYRQLPVGVDVDELDLTDTNKDLCQRIVEG